MLVKLLRRLPLLFTGFSLLDRYLTTELIPPLAFSIAIFSTLGIIVDTLSDLVNKIFELGLPLAIALQILLLKLPEFIAYALPISVLLTTLMTYGRLSSDRELMALQSCGISLYRLVVPGLVLGLVITGISFVFNEWVVPTANYQATVLQRETLKLPSLLLHTQDIFFPEYQTVIQPDGSKIRSLKSLFYAERFDGTAMRKLTFLQWSERSLHQIIVADKAQWNASEQSWHLLSGTVYQINPDASFEKKIVFARQPLKFAQAPLVLARNYRDLDDMSILQAWKYAKLVARSGDIKQLVLFKVSIQQKLAFPFICLVFGLVGSALGARPQNVSRATSFGLCVGIVFFYYVVNFVTVSLGIVGFLSPAIAAWLPNFLGLGIGVRLMRCKLH